MYDRDDFNVPNCDAIIEVPVENIVDVTNVDENEQISRDIENTKRTAEIKIHPDLVDIDFELIADQTSNTLCVKQELANNLVVNCDNIIDENMCMMNEIVNKDDSIFPLSVPQPANRDIGGQFPNPYNAVDVPVCDNLVDLSDNSDKEIEMHDKTFVLNSELEGLVFPVPDQISDNDFAHSTSVSTITVHFQTRNNCPFLPGKICDRPLSFLCDTGAAITTVSLALFKRLPDLTKHPTSTLMTHSIKTVSGESLPIDGLTLSKFQIGENIYPFYAYIVKNLTYDVILGADFLTHYQSVIDFDSSTLQLPPPTDTPPPCPIPDFSCSVHAAMTCVLPPFSESVIPANLHDSAQNVSTSTLVGLVESSSRLIERYSLCGAAALVRVSGDNTIPFRVINPTSQPVTIYRRTNLGKFSSFEPPPVVSIVDDSSTVPNVQPSSTSNSTSETFIDLSHTDLAEEQRAQLTQLLHDNRDVFAFTDDELGHTSLVQHHIDTGNAQPVRQQPYRVSPKVRDCIDEHVEKMLEQGIIQPSVSPWAAPVVLVKKKDGSERFCVDYRKLNSVTRRDSHPIPHVQDTLDCLHGTCYFSCMDLRSGYWQVEVDDESKPKTAFATHSGLFEFRKMPFGLANAPSTFQRLMHAVLRGLHYEICLVYLDDIIIFSRTFEDHLAHLNDVFSRLRSANVRLKPSKCSFARSSVEYLGHVVSRDGITPDPSKIRAVKEFPVPRCTRDVRSFLGLANYYRRFIRNFATIASPLNQLTHKNTRFNWTAACDNAFHELKSSLISAPILAYPDFSLPFELHTDASSTGIGYALCQTQAGLNRAIAYGGRDLNAAERNYSTTEREALAIVEAIKKFRNYLYDRKFTIYTDHHALRWLMSIKDPNGRLARWALLIQQYDFTIVYKAGKLNSDADALSRRSYAEIPTLNAYDFAGVPIERIRQLQHDDAELADLIAYLETSELPTNQNRARSFLLQGDKFYLDENGLLFCLWTPSKRRRYDVCSQLVIPDALKHEILVWAHDDITAGHLGPQKTYGKIRTRYYWRNMFRDIERWCKSCVDCAMKKSPRNRHKAPLLPIPVENAFDRVAVDCLGPFPVSNAGNRYVVVFTEYLTRWPEAFAVPNIDAHTIASLLIDNILARHGAPRTLLSDRGTNFLSALVRAVCDLLNTKKVNTTAYHPQTDGMVERFNHTLCQSVSMYVSRDQKDWDTHLPAVLFGYRVSPHDTTGESPFYLLYGREPRLPVDVSLLPPCNKSNSISEHRARIVQTLEEAHAIARDNIQRAQQNMKEIHDRSAQEPKFMVGDRVWVYTPKTKKGLSRKLMHHWHGPFRIVEKCSPVHFKLRTCDNRLVSVTVHTNRMKPYYDPDSRPQNAPNTDMSTELAIPADELPEDSFPKPSVIVQPTATQSIPSASSTPTETVYNIEKIVKQRTRKGKKQCLVKWEGYSAKHNSWVDETDIVETD